MELNNISIFLSLAFSFLLIIRFYLPLCIIFPYSFPLIFLISFHTHPSTFCGSSFIILFLFDYILLNHSYFILPSLTVSIIFSPLFPPSFFSSLFSIFFLITLSCCNTSLYSPCLLLSLFTFIPYFSYLFFLPYLSFHCHFSLFPLFFYLITFFTLFLSLLFFPFFHSFSIFFYLSLLSFFHLSLFILIPSSLSLSLSSFPPLQRSPHTTRCPRQLRQVHTANGQSATPRVPGGHQPQCDHAHHAQQQQRAVSGAGNTLHGRTRQGDSSEASADLDPRTARVLQWAQPQAAGPEERQAVDQQLDTAWLLRQSRDQRRLRHSQHGCSRGLCWKQLKWRRRRRQFQVTQSQQAKESADGDERQTHVRGARHG